jgi:alkylation response protein AidB-like acyl-CoA dehydrogenase
VNEERLAAAHRGSADQYRDEPAAGAENGLADGYCGRKKSARSEISQIKVIVPRLAQQSCDIVQQAFGAAGMAEDFGLVYIYARLRVMRIGDGPNEVHNRVITRHELGKFRHPRPEIIE